MVFDLSASFGCLGGVVSHSQIKNQCALNQPCLIPSSGLIVSKSVGEIINDMEVAVAQSS